MKKKVPYQLAYDLLAREGMRGARRVQPWDNFYPFISPDVLCLAGDNILKVCVKTWEGESISQIHLRRKFGSIDAVLLINPKNKVYAFLRNMDLYWPIDKHCYTFPLKKIRTWKKYI